jgi:hypothetical protein
MLPLNFGLDLWDNILFAGSACSQCQGPLNKTVAM